MMAAEREALLARIPALLDQHAGHGPWGGNNGSLRDVLLAHQLNPTDFMESLLGWGYTIEAEPVDLSCGCACGCQIELSRLTCGFCAIGAHP